MVSVLTLNLVICDMWTRFLVIGLIYSSVWVNARKAPFGVIVLEIDDQKVVCDICKVSLCYKTSVTNLKRHIERKHMENATSVVNVSKNAYVEPTTTTFVSSQGSSKDGSTRVLSNENDVNFTHIPERSNNTVPNEPINNVYAPVPSLNNSQFPIFCQKRYL